MAKILRTLEFNFARKAFTTDSACVVLFTKANTWPLTSDLMEFGSPISALFIIQMNSLI